MSTINLPTITQLLLRTTFCIAHQYTNQLWTYHILEKCIFSNRKQDQYKLLHGLRGYVFLIDLDFIPFSANRNVDDGCKMYSEKHIYNISWFISRFSRFIVIMHQNVKSSTIFVVCEEDKINGMIDVRRRSWSTACGLLVFNWYCNV